MSLSPEGHTLRPVLAEEVLGILLGVLQDVNNLDAVPVIDVRAAQKF